ncbi:DUF4837 family protein [Marinigracilibium pacificum]|uniref:DUF4837 family protein n=1 Tax=Marinigracilibium pacificum TaxID=2729599 RepID=A0A848J2V2_9BACT|nr:DUF4837 family protein [Marinigracilibium pacificum]NMM48659.1 DUF4837 family protein [Marinigracilibium pacificum]
MLRSISKSIFIVIAGLLIVSCDKSSNENSNPNNLPRAAGEVSQLMIIADDNQYSGMVKETIGQVFGVNTPGLPRPEPIYDVFQIPPQRLNRTLREMRNVLILATSKSPEEVLELYSSEAKEELKKDPSQYFSVQRNVYSKNQTVGLLYAENEALLIKYLHDNKEKLRELYVPGDLKVIRSRTYANQPKKSVAEQLIKKHQFSMQIPGEYMLAKETDNMVWFRNALDKADYSIWAYYTDYKDESVFTKDSLVAFRNRIAKENFYVDPKDPRTYISTEQDYSDVEIDTVNFNNNFAVEMRGLWRSNYVTMGGPFLSYTFVDQSRNRLYYIEGFLYSPGLDQRNPMKRIEIILRSFKMHEEK